MSSVTIPEIRYPVVYPESDGQPMAENTKQFDWIVTIKCGLETLFANDPLVFVAGDLLWYPVEGNPKIRTAPDAMVVFGRPKGHRGSYIQFLEDNISPHVVFEVLSPGNRPAEMLDKLRFYNQYGVEEYYIYDPDDGRLTGYLRGQAGLAEISVMEGWTSPRLKIQFFLAGINLELFGPDGRVFVSYLELDRQRRNSEQRADQEMRRADEESLRADGETRRADGETRRADGEARRAEAETRRAETEARRAELAEQRALRLAAKLSALGIDPNGDA